MNTQELLRVALKLIRAGEPENCFTKVNEAFACLESPATLSSKSDFYLAVLFEQLLLTKSENEVSSLFELTKTHILLQQGPVVSRAGYSVKAYIKAMHGLGVIEKAADEIINIIAIRRDHFGSQDVGSSELQVLLLDELNGLSPDKLS